MMDEEKKRKKLKHQDGSGDGKEEEGEAKGGTSEGREEEAGILNPCVNPDSYHAGTILTMLERERMVLMMSNPSSVAPKI